MESTGKNIYSFIKRIFPIDRWLMGDGVRKTLDIIKEELPDLSIYGVASGTRVFDWEIPKEWCIQDAYILDPDGNKILDYKKNNLSIVGYSVPVSREVTLNELCQVIYTQKEQPDAVPYITSYYKERYGFCMSENQKRSLKEGMYYINIDSRLYNGELNYAELVIPGESSKEVFLSTYICHPSMANDNCSGIGVLTFLAKWLLDKKRKYTYRIIFVPETIGAVAYLAMHKNELQNNVIAGYNLSCVGDNNDYSYIKSRKNVYSEQVLKNVLEYSGHLYHAYPYTKRGSDERQYDFPGIDLPVITFCRSKFHEFKEYHTSLDNMDYISPDGLQGSFETLIKCIIVIENNKCYRNEMLCEAQLGKRGLYPTLSQKNTYGEAQVLLDFMSYADGESDFLEISKNIGISAYELVHIAGRLKENGLIK